ncbi:MAG: flippase-like domain-containing protein [Chitinophagaceae bacterium]|nr:flippase-like domain-containing protein [Chitinophagaceae bacterium]
MKKKLLTALKYLLFLGLGIFLVWWSIHKMSDKDWSDCKMALRSARYILFIPVFFIISASHVSRALRWRILMRPMGYNPSLHNTFFAVMIGYLANLAFPRFGEVLKCTILARYEKVPADKLVGTILVERVVDVVCLGLVFLITIVTQFDLIGQFAKDTIRTNFLKGGSAVLAVKTGILIAVLIIFYFVLKLIFKKYSHNTVIIKIKSIGMIITPGGIGAYPDFVKSVLILYGVSKGVAFANGNLQWIAQTAIILLVGFICLALLPYFNKKEDIVKL